MSDAQDKPTENDPYSDFSIPQDTDLVADQPAGEQDAPAKRDAADRDVDPELNGLEDK